MRFLSLLLLASLPVACSDSSSSSSSSSGGRSTPLPTCPAAPTNVITHTGETAAGVTEVWKADEGIHTLDFYRTVRGTLVIEPCAQVRLGADVSIEVVEGGKLQVGAPGGGLVEMDAIDASKPWLAIHSVTDKARVEVINASLKNGGSTETNGGGTIAMRGNHETGALPSSNILLVDNVRIENSRTFGIYLDGNGAFDPASKDLVITGSKKSPIGMYGKAMGSIPTGTYTGNGDDWFQCADTFANDIDTDTTWVDRGIPINVNTGDLVIGKRDGVAALTIKAGVVVQMYDTQKISVGRGSGDKTPTGALIVEGSAEKPVTFRGKGNKNDWAGIRFFGAVDARSHFDHVVVEDVGANDTTIGAECVRGLDASKPVDHNSGAIGFFLSGNDADINLRLDFLANSTIRRSGSNGVLPDFHPGNGLDFCATNTFEDVALCNQTPFRNAEFKCDGPETEPVKCACE